MFRWVFSYGEYHDLTSRIGWRRWQPQEHQGSLTSLDAAYHFGAPGVGLRPYVSAGVAHQSIGQADRGGRDRSTFATWVLA